MSVPSLEHILRRRQTYLMNATIGRIRAFLVYPSSVVKTGTCALRSLNRRSMSIPTCCRGSRVSSGPVGAVRAGLASSRWPGILSVAVFVEPVAILSTISATRALMSKSPEGSGGKVMSRTASTFPEVIQEMGPVPSLTAFRWSMLTPSTRNRV